VISIYWPAAQAPAPEFNAKCEQLLDKACKYGYRNPETDDDGVNEDDDYPLDSDLADLLFLAFKAGYEAATGQHGGTNETSDAGEGAAR
jgi:hypothetical protein